jgi:diguanylate cyclase (GGDEF)-like protein
MADHTHKITLARLRTLTDSNNPEGGKAAVVMARVHRWFCFSSDHTPLPSPTELLSPVGMRHGDDQLLGELVAFWDDVLSSPDRTSIYQSRLNLYFAVQSSTDENTSSQHADPYPNPPDGHGLINQLKRDHGDLPEPVCKTILELVKAVHIYREDRATLANDRLKLQRTMRESIAGFFEMTTQMFAAKGEAASVSLQLDHVNELARIDPLTGLGNRLALKEFFDHRQSSAPLAVIKIDLDNFKSLNDTHGHKAGDDALIATAKMMMMLTPKGRGHCFRDGGDELAITLYTPQPNEAFEIAEALRLACEHGMPNTSDPLLAKGLNFGTHGTGAFVGVRCSIGVVHSGAELLKNMTGDMLVHAADFFAYKAKEAGKNCVKTFGHATQATIDEMIMSFDPAELPDTPARGQVLIEQANARQRNPNMERRRGGPGAMIKRIIFRMIKSFINKHPSLQKALKRLTDAR